MNPNIDLETREREAYLMEYRKQVYTQFERLLASRTSLSSIADLLDAQEFLTSQEQGGKREPVYTFDVRGFVDREVKKKDPLLLPFEFDSTSDVIIPPDSNEYQTPGGNGGSFEKPDMIPRTRFLAEVLSELRQPYAVVDGKNTSEMMRGASYKVFLLPNAGKIVFVNDEEGNATFVVHGFQDVLSEWEQYAAYSKERLKTTDAVDTIIYSTVSVWKEKIKASITAEGPLSHGRDHSDKEVQKVGEMAETQQAEVAPDGWMNLYALSKLYSNQRSILKKIIDQYRHDHPEWFKNFRTRKGGNIAEHFHPDLVAKAQQDMENRPPEAPEGWLSVYECAQALGKTRDFVQGFVDRFQEDHPEWFHTYSTRKAGMITMHIHPDLVEKMRRIVESLPGEAPEGWLTLSRCAKLFGRDIVFVRSVSEESRGEHPDWFRNFVDKKSKNISEYLHPDLVAKIKEVIEQLPPVAPEGWMGITECMDVFGKSEIFLRNILEVYLDDHPDWVKIFTSKKSGKATEYFHPELVAKIKEVVEKLPTDAPDGWMSVARCAVELDKDWGAVKLLAEKYRTTHPEWFKDYYAKKNRHVVEHLHPDLVAAVKRDFGL